MVDAFARHKMLSTYSLSKAMVVLRSRIVNLHAKNYVNDIFPVRMKKPQTVSSLNTFHKPKQSHSRIVNTQHNFEETHPSRNLTIVC